MRQKIKVSLDDDFKKCLNNRRQTVPRLPLSQSAALEKSVKHLMTFN